METPNKPKTTCKICGNEFKSIEMHVAMKHGTCMNEYNSITTLEPRELKPTGTLNVEESTSNVNVKGPTSGFHYGNEASLVESPKKSSMLKFLESKNRVNFIVGAGVLIIVLLILFYFYIESINPINTN